LLEVCGFDCFRRFPSNLGEEEIKHSLFGEHDQVVFASDNESTPWITGWSMATQVRPDN
jgi:hypothetical protein